jgi:hypothetical protein
MGKYTFENNTFNIEDYDELFPFSSFLPGIAGVKGIPLWLFYTNRGQCVNSFGIHDKDHAIMEFNPANTAYENTSIKGFRTFMKINGIFYEPFHGFDGDYKRRMHIRDNSFWIEEINEKLKIKVTVKYFMLPNEFFGALARKVTIQNNSDLEYKIEILDGLPKIIPYGIKNSEYKEMSNLLKSWTEIKKVNNKILFYTTRGSNEDSEEVIGVNEGYFYISFIEDHLLCPIYDNDIIFGCDTSFEKPVNFIKHSLEEIISYRQEYANRIPGGFTPADVCIKSGETIELKTLIGLSQSLKEAKDISSKVVTIGYFEQKEKEAEDLISCYTKDVNTSTDNTLFDQYIKQCYLDNFLRGGYPFVIKNSIRNNVIYLFSRKHGDPERDYNFFSTVGEYYSQGNGNFRDVSQNRRNDVFFHPQIEDFNIRTFFSLIQADGYNPLEVGCSTFSVKSERKETLKEFLEETIHDINALNKVNQILDTKFTPGKLISGIHKQGLQLNMDEDQFLYKIIGFCNQNIEAVFKEGFWSDHFTYNMDLVEDYLRIYPDKKKQLLFENTNYLFYDSPVRVLPRKEKYVITDYGVRQFGAVLKDQEKCKNRGFNPDGTNWLVDSRGKIIKVSLFVKMLALVSIKFATLDPEGMGLEMEAGKPGWNDAMNGLPGLIGSGMPETIELERLARFLLTELDVRKEYLIPEEIVNLIHDSISLMELLIKKNISDFEYWDKMADARENYRESIRFFMSGKQVYLKGSWLIKYLSAVHNKISEGINKAIKLGNGLMPTYFTYHATQFMTLNNVDGTTVSGYHGFPVAKVENFEMVILPMFLEGPARYLRVISDKNKANIIYKNIKNSDLYDKKLKMYKTSVSLDNASMELGRICSFTPGWLERESIFLHMEYKYLLGILKSGLYDCFFSEIKNTLVPFLNPEIYGRSTIENSSFIASSNNPDLSTHGRGYVARLSGSTTEILSMWIYIMTGDRPFIYEDNKLTFSLNPILPKWFFDREGEVKFKLCSNTTVIYYNPLRKDTYGNDSVGVNQMIISGVSYGRKLIGEMAEKIRNGEIREIECILG